jgi:MFS family permease
VSARATVAAAIGMSVLSAAPQFLLGSLFVLMHRDIGVSLTISGAAVAASYGVAAFSSLWSGRFVERFGVTRSAQMCMVVLAVSLIAIAAVRVPVPWLVVVAAPAGVALALSQPVSNAMLADVVDASRHGLVFGLKQAATPAAILLAGLAVPVAESAVGWRSVFATAAGSALLLGGLLGARRRRHRDAGLRVVARPRAP